MSHEMVYCDCLLQIAYKPRKGNQQSFNYTAKDIFWGQLVGCLESLDAGVTTVVDHAHMTYSMEHGTKSSMY